MDARHPTSSDFSDQSVISKRRPQVGAGVEQVRVRFHRSFGKGDTPGGDAGRKSQRLRGACTAFWIKIARRIWTRSQVAQSSLGIARERYA
jgi:hypothetical protein